MIRTSFTALAILLWPATALASPFSSEVPDRTLATMRGGMALPGGLQVQMGVTTDTRINGEVVLRTVLTANQGPATLAVQAGNGSGGVSDLDLAGEQEVSGPNGTVRLTRSPGSTKVQLKGEGVDVSHLLGRNIGSVVANEADGRSIDVVTTVDLNISNADPALIGSSMLRAEDLALQSTANLTR